MTHSFDIAISGAGIIGSLFAYALAHEKIHVALIEKRELEKNLKTGRSFALSYANACILKNLGLWTDVSLSHTPIEHIIVSKQGTRQGIHYRAQDMNVDALGFMVQEVNMIKALRNVTLKHPFIHWFCPQHIHHSSLDPYGITLELDDGLSLKSKICVGADGKNSFLRQQISPHTLSRNYAQKALSFTIAHTKPHHNRAFEHFTNVGPLAFLPLSDQRSAVIWSVHSDLANRLSQAPSTLIHALFNHFGYGLGTLSLVSPILSYPLSLELPWTQNSNRQVLIGDAAHTIHPVAGQGLNLGIRDVFALADHLKKRHELGLDLGLGLDSYSKRRTLDHRSMAFATHSLVHALETNWTTPLWRLGAFVIDLCAPLKESVVRQAMGFGIDSELDTLCHLDSNFGAQTGENHPNL